MFGLFRAITLNLCVATYAIGSPFTSFTDAEKAMIIAGTMAGLAEADKKIFLAKHQEAQDLVTNALFAYTQVCKSDGNVHPIECKADLTQASLIEKDLYLYIYDEKRGLRGNLHVYNLDTRKIAPVIEPLAKQ